MTITKNPMEAVGILISTLKSGIDAWLSICKNGQVSGSVMKVNPLLDDPNNWELLRVVPRNGNRLQRELEHCINACQKDLTCAYVCVGRKAVPYIGSTKDLPVIYCWKPKDGIKTYIPDSSVADLYIVQEDTTSAPDYTSRIKEAAALLMKGTAPNPEREFHQWSKASADIIDVLKSMDSGLTLGFCARSVEMYPDIAMNLLSENEDAEIMKKGTDVCIRIINNKEAENPIMKVNPVFDDPFNWEFAYGTVCSKEELESHKFLNDTERDLTLNWTSGFGEPEAIRKYKETGEISEGLLRGVGTCFPIRKDDVNKHRRKYVGDGYDYYLSLFVNFWRAKRECGPLWVPDEQYSKVFVPCYTEEKRNQQEIRRDAAEFLQAYAAAMETHELN